MSRDIFHRKGSLQGIFCITSEMVYHWYALTRHDTAPSMRSNLISSLPIVQPLIAYCMQKQRGRAFRDYWSLFSMAFEKKKLEMSGKSGFRQLPARHMDFTLVLQSHLQLHHLSSRASLMPPILQVQPTNRKQEHYPLRHLLKYTLKLVGIHLLQMTQRSNLSFNVILLENSHVILVHFVVVYTCSTLCGIFASTLSSHACSHEL